MRTTSSHSITLFESIDRSLLSLGITINDINLIGAGIGPGSFTGIRIAVTSARMLSQVLAVPIVGFQTHRIFASSVKGTSGERIIIAFDAKKERVFGAVYQKTDDETTPSEIVPPGDYYIDRLLQAVKGQEKTILVGDGIKKSIDLININLKNFEYLEDFLPSGEIACRITQKLYETSPNLYGDLNKVLPLYKRKSDAEIFCGGKIDS